MIIGIGTDIVAVSRIQHLIDQYGEKFVHRILGREEYIEFEKLKSNAHTPQFLAKLFAAKEATVKALGTGFAKGISYKDVCVKHTREGKPILQFGGEASVFISERGITRAHLSLSDEKEIVIAFVVLEGE